MVTVALPAWQAEIIWLQLESLCRQETDCEWELIISECESLEARNHLGVYWGRLEKAGCVNIVHHFNNKRLRLGDKWRQIAQKARGRFFILAAADNYSPPDRIQRAYKVLSEGYDWTDTTEGLFLNIPTGAEATYVRKKGRSGLWMATRTEHIRALAGRSPESSVDGWIHSQLPKGYTWHVDEGPRMGLHTDGFNTISLSRSLIYEGRIHKPFTEPTQRTEDILPEEVYERLCRAQPQTA